MMDIDLDFYHLERDPFPRAPDPTCLFLSPSHRTALQAIIKGIETRQGFVAIIGKAGLGKTTLLQAYLASVDSHQLTTIFLPTTSRSLGSMLATLCQAYGLDCAPDDLAVMVDRLRQLLIKGCKQEQNVALIIDDAHNLPVQTLWHLRMLSELMETSLGQLVQIVLVGRLELAHKYNRPELRQLKQRLVQCVTLSPLTPHESLAYIHYHLAQVTTDEELVFTPKALTRIVKHAHGIPRVLNTLCAEALAVGLSSQSKPISATIVRNVIAHREEKTTSPLWRWGLAGAAGLLLVLGFLGLSPYSPLELSPFTRPKTRVPLAAYQSPKSLAVQGRMTDRPTLPQAVGRKITLVTGNGYAPFTDETLPQQGMLTEVIRTAFAAIGYEAEIVFRAWQSGFDATQEGTFAGTFPYVRHQAHTAHFLYSKPLYHVSIRAFVRRESRIAFDTLTDLRGLTVCQPKGAFAPDLRQLFEAQHMTLTISETPAACFHLLLQAKVDVVAVHELAGQRVLRKMGLADKVRALDKALWMTSLHLMLPKFALESHTLVYEFDQALALLEQTGVLQDITMRHVQQYDDSPHTLPTSLTLTGERR